MESTVQFKIMGNFRNGPDDDGEKDTFYVDVPTLVDMDVMSTAELKCKVKDFYRASYAAAIQAIDEYDAERVAGTRSADPLAAGSV